MFKNEAAGLSTAEFCPYSVPAMQILIVHNAIVLGAIAAADVARSAWVMAAILDPSRSATIGPWLATGLILATGGISIAMLGLAARALLERNHAGFDRPSPLA